MAEVQRTLTREHVREMVEAARERLEARRTEMLLENTRPLERVHVREYTRDLDMERSRG